MRAEIEIKNWGLIVQMFLREWCVIARRPNFCINWFPDVFLMSTKFLALKSQRYFSLLQCYFRYIMANSLFNSFFMCGLTWYLEMSLTTNCGIKLLFINMVEDEFRDIAKHRALEIYAEGTAVEGTGLSLHQNDQVYSRPAFQVGFFFSTEFKS